MLLKLNKITLLDYNHNYDHNATWLVLGALLEIGGTFLMHDHETELVNGVQYTIDELERSVEHDAS